MSKMPTELLEILFLDLPLLDLVCCLRVSSQFKCTIMGSISLKEKLWLGNLEVEEDSEDRSSRLADWALKIVSACPSCAELWYDRSNAQA